MSSTANPRHPNNPPSDPPSEPTGAIAKDSLAAESIESGGAFGDNENPVPLGVKGASSTLANTDTSGADKLPPAQSSTIRDGDPSVPYPDSGATNDNLGTTSDTGYVGGPITGSKPSTDTAPTYTADTTSEGESKPKGENLVEGGDIPENRPTYTGDVGGSKDPGRLAERDFQKVNANVGGSGVNEYGNVKKGGDENPYGSLGTTNDA